jgi:hypothetical protein
MTQWENLPEPTPERQVARVTPSWSGFSADPRQPGNQPLRASDADRDFATRLLEQARIEGRLDATEYGARASQALASRTLGELGPLVSDLMVGQPAPFASPRQGPPPGFLRGWVGLAVLFNVIWLITVVTTGHFLYYWPIWPMLGTGVPVFMALMFGGSRNPDWAGQRAEYRAARHQARAERHALRHQGRALQRGQVPPQLPPPPPEQDLR